MSCGMSRDGTRTESQRRQDQDEAEGWLARIFNEIDHLDGVLYIDKLVPKIPCGASERSGKPATSGRAIG
jgi:peptide deformylase